MVRVRLVALVLVLFPSLAVAQAPRRYTLTVTALTVAETKPDGRPWDGGIAYAKPDPVVLFNRVDPVATRKLTVLGAEQQQLERLQWQAEQAANAPANGRPRRLMPPFTPAQAKRLEDVRTQGAELRATFMAHTEVVQDTVTATFQLGTLEVNIGEQVFFDVWDKDVLVDDGMGSLRVTITADMVRKGEATLKFGSVKALTVKIVPK